MRKQTACSRGTKIGTILAASLIVMATGMGTALASSNHTAVYEG